MNVMREIQRKVFEIEALKVSLRDAESDLQALKARRLQEISLRKCPQCGKWVKVPLPSHMDHHKETIDCPQCQSRLTAVIDQLPGDPLSEDSYRISLSRSGWSYEDEPPSNLTDQQIQSLIDDLSVLPETGRTRVQRARLAALLNEKTRRVK